MSTILLIEDHAPSRANLRDIMLPGMDGVETRAAAMLAAIEMLCES